MTACGLQAEEGASAFGAGMTALSALSQSCMIDEPTGDVDVPNPASPRRRRKSVPSLAAPPTRKGSPRKRNRELQLPFGCGKNCGPRCCGSVPLWVHE